MPFTASFAAAQTIDGATLIITDTSNYGFDATHNKSNFTSRTLTITRGDTLSPITYSFPYTNTNNAIQDTYSIAITQDYAYSITLTLVDTLSTNYVSSAPVIATEFTQLKKRKILSMIQPGGCNTTKLCQTVQMIDAAISAASNRAAAGDTGGAQTIVNYAFELASNICNC